MNNVPIMPSNIRQQEITKAIENRVRPVLGEDADIWLDRPFTLYTFAVRTLTSLINVLGEAASRVGITNISIYPQITVYLSSKESDEEKEGNLNVFFSNNPDVRVTLDDMKNFIVPTRKQSGEEIKILKLQNPSDPNEEKLMRQINMEATKDLQYKNAIMVVDTDIPTLITSYYLAGMYDVLGQMAAEGGHLVMYNLGDVIEVSCIIRDGEPFYRILPGVSAKLTIKQDSFTEND